MPIERAIGGNMSLCGLALSFNNLCELGDPILQPCCFRECFSLHRCGFGDHQTGNLGHDGGTRRTRVRIRRPTSPLQTRRRGVPAFATPDDIRSGTLGVAQCIHTSLAVRGERGDQHDPDQREDADGEPGDAFDGGEGTDAQTHSAPPRSGGRGCDGHGRKGHGRQVECPHVEIVIVGTRHCEDRHGREEGMEEGGMTAPLDSRRPPSPQPQPPWLLAMLEGLRNHYFKNQAEDGQIAYRRDHAATTSKYAHNAWTYAMWCARAVV